MNKSNNWVALACILWVGNVQAALVDFSWTGQFTDSPGTGTDLDFLLSQSVVITGTFDDSAFLIPGDPTAGIANFSSGSTNAFTVTFDVFSFSNTDEISYSGGTYPYMQFNTAIPDVFMEFQSNKYTDTIFSLFDSSFYFQDASSSSRVTGVMDDASFTISNIPIPAAIWLFSSGLLGMIGIARRRKAA